MYLNQQSSSKNLEGDSSYKVTRVTLNEEVLDEISNQNEVPNTSNESSSQFPFWGLNLPGINLGLGSWKKRKESSESNNTVEVKNPNEWFQDVSLNGNVSFSLQSQETRTEIVNKGKDVSLKDIENMDVSTILNTDFIDKHILDPLAKYRTTVGIEENKLSSRLDFINDLTTLQSTTLSRIEDADFAKEIMNQIKQEMLLNTNINLFQNNSYQYRQHIVQLLQ
ncbi:hypothetical protein D7X33_37110 [Butyricicoccus sp. 1XD8-22]|nr:hypothetical protein D7X33_37110 [Butyricicoccus sp. 1XD8-22]